MQRSLCSLLCLAALALACSPAGSAGPSGGGDSSTSEGTTAAIPETTTTEDTTSNNDFVSVLDYPLPPPDPNECSLGGDDCPPDHKCVPLDPDVAHYNVCAPVVPDPVGDAEVCTRHPTMPDMPVDDCDAQHYCLVTNLETQTGNCAILCGLVENGWGDGPGPDPTLCHRGQVCTEYGEVLHACLDRCDPLVQDCLDGWGCYTIQADALCAPTGSNVTLGGECQYLDECQPGLGCIPARVEPDCASVGCCAPYCDTTQPDECDAVLPGTVCSSWWGEGQEPTPGLESLGFCGLPGA